MSSDKNELIGEIAISVKELARRGGISTERAFGAWYATTLLDFDEDQALEGASVDGPEDQGIDVLLVDHPNGRITVLQAHYPKRRDKATPKPKWDALVASIPAIQNPKLMLDAGRSDIADILEEAGAGISEYDIELGLISLSKKSDQIERACAQANRSPQFRGIKFFYASADDILNQYIVFRSADKSVPEDTISFAGGVFEDSGEYGRAIVGSVPASELGRLYTTHGRRLFEGNVRFFIGARKGGINERMIETAKTSPGLFWALNNGITIVANTCTKDNAQTYRLTRFSIVNGCQTTVSLHNSGAPANANVLTRVVAAKPTLLTDIVRYNNTQNPVKIWAVRSVDPVQERLRESFKKINIQYAPKQEGSRRRKDYQSIMELDRVAQYMAAGYPDTLIDAVKEKQELFDRHYQRLFPHDVGAETVYLYWLLGIQTDEERQSKLQSLVDAGDADKTTGALLGVSGTYWGVHCSSKLAEELNRTPLGISLEAMASPEFQNALRKYAIEGLQLFTELAIDTYDPDDFKSVRAALRSPRFLQKIDQKLALRMSRYKNVKNKKLTDLVSAAKTSVSSRSGSSKKQ